MMKIGESGLRWFALASITTVVLTGLMSCGAHRKSGDADVPGELQAEGDLRAKFAREAEPEQQQLVKTSAWRAYIESTAPPTVETHKTHTLVTAELGWESEVQCFVYKSAIDTGAVMSIMLQSAAEEVDFQRISPYAFVPISLEPLVAVRAVYHTQRNGVTLAGDYKLVVVPRAEHPIMCVHDGPGYAESLVRLVTKFAKSFKYDSEQPAPQRTELWRLTLEDVPVGFARTATYPLGDGSVRTVSVSARFLPQSATDLTLDDEVTVLDTTSDGDLLSGKYISVENAEATYEIDVEKGASGYSYLGTLQGKEIRGKFKLRGAVSTSHSLSQTLRDAAGKNKKLKTWEYIPNVDPTQPIEIAYEITSSDQGMDIVTKLGQSSMMLHASRRGVLQQVEMQLGTREMMLDLVAAEGEL